MKIKTLITALLLVFVTGSLAYLMVGEYHKSNKGDNFEQHKSNPTSLNTSSDGITQKTPSPIKHTVIAYYFHCKARCASCLKIESYSKEAIDKNFEKEIESGRLEWKVINVDETENKHFIKEYKLYTKSVIIADMRNDKQTRWKNLEQVWELLHDKETFLYYVYDEIKAYFEES